MDTSIVAYRKSKIYKKIYNFEYVSLPEGWRSTFCRSGIFIDKPLGFSGNGPF